MIYPHNFEHKIGFDQIRNILKLKCLSTLGEDKVDEMTFIQDFDKIKEQLAQTYEFLLIIQEKVNFPDQYFFDVRPSLKRVRIEGMYLEEQELFDLRRSLDTIINIVHFLKTVPDDHEENDYPYPHLSKLAGNIFVFPRLVNTKTNEVMLKNTPHRDFLDMSIVYYIEQYNDELGAIEGIRITNELMQSENLSEEELYHNSMKNMLEKEKSRLIPMIKVIMSIQFGIPLRETEISESDFSDGDFIMLSNERGINGSRRLLDTRALIKASEIAESDLYILPSSTQEVLIVSVNEINASPSELKNMVREVNISEVSKEERLTDNVYIFRRDTRTIEIA